jgi:hypothetical protein
MLNTIKNSFYFFFSDTLGKVMASQSVCGITRRFIRNKEEGFWAASEFWPTPYKD